MVLLPHGGPFGIFDTWWFDDESQMLAEAGYAVLRVNYRGSANYGREFLHAGATEWGQKLQHDLTDATRWAIAQNITDPKRICIYGASYGGYAALMGAATEPDLYRCAVGYAGVYDMAKLHKDVAGDSRSGRAWAEQCMGQREDMAAISPTGSKCRCSWLRAARTGSRRSNTPRRWRRRLKQPMCRWKVCTSPTKATAFIPKSIVASTTPGCSGFYRDMSAARPRNKPIQTVAGRRYGAAEAPTHRRADKAPPCL